MLTLGSLFDGIGTWQLSAKHNGIKPLWSCEIDQYPSAVSHYHFPETKQYGDIKEIHGNSIEPVDILCAGTPCQNISQAGNHKGLAGEQSSLFYEAIRILQEMRRATNGKYPRFFVWENVVGAFSCNHGNDFRTVLEEIGQSRLPMPRKWGRCGVARLPLCDIAWRVLDAQYWGVPQRRRRIFLVADFATTERRAAEILLVEKRLSGDSQEGSGKEQGSSNGTGTGTHLNTNKASARYTVYETNKSRTLNTQASDPTSQQGGGAIVENIEMYDMTHADEVMRLMHGDKVNTLNSRMGTGGNQVPVLHDKEIRRVRKLTPLETERLQGLSDGYTDIEFKGKPASDSRRYKAIGNGMAVPCSDFVLRRIKEEVECQQ